MPTLTAEQIAQAKAQVLANAPTLAVLRRRNPPPGRNLAYWPIPFRTRTSTNRWRKAHQLLILILLFLPGCAMTTTFKVKSPIGTVTRDTHTTISTELHDYAPTTRSIPEL